MNKKNITIGAIGLLLVIVIANIYTVTNKQNELLEELDQKEIEITQLREQKNIESKYPKIIQYNWLANDYNTCLKVFPNNIYNSLFLDKKPIDYLIK